MKTIRTLYALTAVICLAMMAAPTARAASEPRILQQRLDADALTLYVCHADGAAADGAQIDGIEAEDAEIAKDASETSLRTWILFDNSESMPESARAKASDLLTTLLGERGRGETYNFAVFSNRLNVELRDCNSFVDMKSRIDGIAYQGQRSDLIGALREVLAEESARTGTEFVRIIIVTAGGDSVPTEQDIEGLQTSGNAVSGVPIYAIGCDNGANGEALSQMYALSERTRARFWNLAEVGASDIAKIMRWEEIPIKASLAVPESVRTGAAREIAVTFSDGSIARSAVIASGVGVTPTVEPEQPPEAQPEQSPQSQTGQAPGAQIEPEAQPQQEPEPEAQAGQEPQTETLVALVLVAAALVGLGVFLFLRRKRGDGAFGGRGSFKNAVIDISGSGVPTLCLTDMDDAERQFSAPLQGAVTIGRSPDNIIALGYDKSISRRHCEVYLRKQTLRIRDCNSSAGVYVGNERIKGAAPLPNGSVIRLGHVSYKVEVQ